MKFSKEEVLKILEGAKDAQGNVPFAIVKKAIEKLATEPEWIPCSEGLPKEGHDVLITKESFKIKGYEQEVIKAKRSVDPRSGKIEWWSPEFGTLTNKAVLAWVPLPPRYKGDKT